MLVNFPCDRSSCTILLSFNAFTAGQLYNARNHSNVIICSLFTMRRVGKYFSNSSQPLDVVSQAHQIYSFRTENPPTCETIDQKTKRGSSRIFCLPIPYREVSTQMITNELITPTVEHYNSNAKQPIHRISRIRARSSPRLCKQTPRKIFAQDNAGPSLSGWLGPPRSTWFGPRCANSSDRERGQVR